MSSLILWSRLVTSPELVRGVRALPPEAFAALVRRVGVEDAGEIVALATTEQLVAAFDEELFAGRPGERATFDVARFTTWLEVLLEAGDAATARRASELSPDFWAHALGHLVLVLDREALMMRMGEGDARARRADKAIDASISEEIDGYLLVARRPDGWDAVMALVAALDRDHRALLEHILDCCAASARGLADDLDALCDALADAETLADDVEAEREARRAARGHVEPRAARAFLALAHARDPGPRDPLTRAYFRELAPAPAAPSAMPPELVAALAEAEPTRALPSAPPPILAALRALPPDVADRRVAELAYLANVLVAALGRPPPAAADEVLAVVARALTARGARSPDDIARVLATTEADRLFRDAW